MTTIVNTQNKTIDRMEENFFSVCRSKMKDAAQVAQKAAGNVFGFCTHPTTVFFAVGSLLNSYLPLPEYLRFPASYAAATAAQVGVMVMKMKTRASEKAAPIAATIPLSKASTLIEITKANYKKEVLESKTPVILDAYATWCPPCKAVAPLLDQMSNEMHGKVKFVKFNVDSDASLAKELNITSMPTFLMFKGGKMVNRQVGVDTLNKNEFALNLIKHLL
jgi:thioredoxin 1